MDSKKAKEKLGEASEKVKHSLEDAGEKAREAGGKAKEKLGEAGEKVKHSLEDAGEKARDEGKKLMGQASEGIRNVRESSWFKSITAITWTGLALAALFTLFMLADALNYRWWIMQPLGVAALLLLGKQWYVSEDRKGFEARVCLVAFVAMSLLMLYRDAWLSGALIKQSKAVLEIKDILK